MSLSEAERIVCKLTAAQLGALRLSGDGWALSYYIPVGTNPGDRRSVYGSPYWCMQRGRANETPKAPHWRVASSLQDKGLIGDGSVGESITELGRQVLAIADRNPKGEDVQQASSPLPGFGHG